MLLKHLVVVMREIKAQSKGNCKQPPSATCNARKRAVEKRDPMAALGHAQPPPVSREL